MPPADRRFGRRQRGHGDARQPDPQRPPPRGPHDRTPHGLAGVCRRRALGDGTDRCQREPDPCLHGEPPGRRGLGPVVADQAPRDRDGHRLRRDDQAVLRRRDQPGRHRLVGAVASDQPRHERRTRRCRRDEGGGPLGRITTSEQPAEPAHDCRSVHAELLSSPRHAEHRATVRDVQMSNRRPSAPGADALPACAAWAQAQRRGPTAFRVGGGRTGSSGDVSDTADLATSTNG